jgi:hypothetical protein
VAFWSRKKNKSAGMREVALPGEMGTISLPSNFKVEMEDDNTLLAYLVNEDAISLRASSLSFCRKDGNDETAGKVAVQERAQKKGLHYYERDDKGILAYEEPSEQDGIPLVIKYWYVGSKNTMVILSATIDANQINRKSVHEVLATIPRIVESVKINTIRRVIEGEDRQIETYVTTAEPTPQRIEPFRAEENAWLETNLKVAAELNLKYGSGGDFTPQELDAIFSRWMQEEEKKETGEAVANALGAAFGEFLVEQKGFRWVVVTDEYGTEYAVKCDIGEVTAFPRASIEKRIEDGIPELFQNIYLMILDQLKRCKEDESGLDAG